MRIGCVGMATLDTLLFTPDHDAVHDAVTTVESAVVCPGGKGIVTAVAMRHLGVDVVPLGLVGRGSAVREALAARLDDRYLLPLLDADRRTWITVSKGQKVVTYVAEDRAPPSSLAPLRSAVAALADEVDGLYLTAENPAGVLDAAIGALQNDVPIGLNLSTPLLMLLADHPSILRDIVIGSRFVFCNEGEGSLALEALGVESWAALESPLLREVVVTTGASGGDFSIAPFEGWEHFDAHPASEIRCVVGAGDTFNGAYLASRLVAGESPAESCRIAAELAAAKVAERGSTLPLDALEAI